VGRHWLVLLAAVCGCETWSVTLICDNSLRVLESKVLSESKWRTVE
jgi:hypothetical protein